MKNSWLLLFLVSNLVIAEEKSVQPYIDQLKSGLEKKESPESYIETLKKKLKPEEDSLGYSERLRQSLEEKNRKPTDGYADQVKATLEDKKLDGAIEAVQQGKSELHAKFKGEIRHAFGFKMAPSPGRNYTNTSITSTGQAFSTIYGSNWSPDISLFYEWQPFHSEWLGNIGVVFNLTFGYSHGLGAFLRLINNSPENQGDATFSGSSMVPFQFFTIPISIGLNYRFNLLRVVRPFAFAGPTLIGYFENRQDSNTMMRGNSRGITLTAGVNVLLDWFTPGARWDLYSEHGVKHSYLTVDYTKLITFSGDVNFDNSALSLGFTFEY